MYQAFKYPWPVLLGNIALLSSKLNAHFFLLVCHLAIGSSSESMKTSSSPEQTAIIAVATTSTVVTTSKLKPPQEKLLKVAPPVKPKSTKKSSTRSKLRHSTGNQVMSLVKLISHYLLQDLKNKEQSAHWVTYFPYH